MKLILERLSCLIALASILVAGEASRSVVNRDEALLLRDAAAFLGSPQSFDSRGDATSFLSQIFPEGMPEALAKKKVGSLISNFKATPRQRVSVSLSDRKIVLSCRRIFSPESPTLVTLSFTLFFDTKDQREKGHFAAAVTSEGWNGPLDDLEP